MHPANAQPAHSWEDLSDTTILITGGTGSFGKKCVELLMRNARPKKLIVFSRDELKQHEMRRYFPDQGDTPIRYFLGDIRDRERLYRAFDAVDVVIHAAALKQVPACEYNPIEAIRTNILGASNIIEAAIDRDVKRVLALSTDKAVSPVNLYGATKLCAEKLFVAANAYSGHHRTRFSVVRYGNVMGSRGSVIPLFLRIRDQGEIPITDSRMTRFGISLDQAVDFVLTSLGRMHGGEIFVPKIPSVRVVDLAEAIAPARPVEIVGVRPGEKLHEVLISEDEASRTVEYEDRFTILPSHLDWESREYLKNGGRPCPEGFRYASDNNDEWLSIRQLQDVIQTIELETNSVAGA
jgi:UDP-N-acetylglucosamine 4,6-dehydratase